MSRTLNQLLRPFVPNLTVRIPHVEAQTSLEVRLRQHQESELLVTPDLFKLDIEGGEFDVLRGGSNLLRTHRPVVVSELSSWGEDKSSVTKASMAIELLEQHGYQLWNLDTGAALDDGLVWMVLGVPRERQQEARISAALSHLLETATILR